MMEADYFIHPSSYLDQGGKIGKGSNVWHFCHIASGAQIGANCILGQNVYVGKNVLIGDRVKIQNGVSVYENVTLEDEVFCGPSSVFTNVINPRAAFDRKNEFKNTLVKRGATIGANATIVCGVTLGEYCFVGAGALVTRDVKPFALVTGVSAKQVGWMSRYGEKIPLPLSGSGEFRCPHTGDKLVLENDHLKWINPTESTK